MRYLLPLICLTSLLAVSACETVAGAGQDLSTAGQAVSTQAEKAAN